MPASHLLLILAACLAWAFNFVASAMGLLHFPPFLFTLIRFSLVMVVLLPFLKRPPPGQWWRLVAVALLTGALHFGFNFWGLKISDDVSSVAILVQAYIPMSAVLAALLLGEQVGWRSVVAISVAFSGVLVMGFDPKVFAQLDSGLLVLLGAFFLALGTVLMRGIKGMDPFSYQAWSALISVPFLIPITWLLERPSLELLAAADWHHWGGVVYSALGASIVGHGIYFFLIQRHPVAYVTPYLLLTPMFAVLLGVVLWGDRLSWGLVAGGVLIMGGILTLSLRAKARAAAE
ncbi:MAG: DMT family transporter [Xanthomonadales bacterium]|nr:DMT family transporter [Xanthomonadales bacterium]